MDGDLGYMTQEESRVQWTDGLKNISLPKEYEMQRLMRDKGRANESDFLLWCCFGRATAILACLGEVQGSREALAPFRDGRQRLRSIVVLRPLSLRQPSGSYLHSQVGNHQHPLSPPRPEWLMTWVECDANLALKHILLVQPWKL